MKYAMNQTDGVVKSIIRLPLSKALPAGFVAITESVYNQGISILEAGSSFLTYDDALKEFRADTNRNDTVSSEIRRMAQRVRLATLYSKRTVMTGLGEDVTAINAEIATIQNDYNATA